MGGKKTKPTVEDSSWGWVSSHPKHLKREFVDGALVGAVCHRSLMPQTFSILDTKMYIATINSDNESHQFFLIFHNLVFTVGVVFRDNLQLGVK